MVRQAPLGPISTPLRPLRQVDRLAERYSQRTKPPVVVLLLRSSSEQNGLPPSPKPVRRLTSLTPARLNAPSRPFARVPKTPKPPRQSRAQPAWNLPPFSRPARKKTGVTRFELSPVLAANCRLVGAVIADVGTESSPIRTQRGCRVPPGRCRSCSRALTGRCRSRCRARTGR